MHARLVGGSGRRPPAAQLQLEAAADAASTASAACPAGKPGIDQDSDGEEKQSMPKASSIPEEHESSCRISFFAHFMCRVPAKVPACRSLPPGLPLNLALMPRECLVADPSRVVFLVSGYFCVLLLIVLCVVCLVRSLRCLASRLAVGAELD